MNDRPAEELTFEQALTQLESVVRSLEDGKLGLEDALSCYEKGIALIRHCHGRLESVEQRILELTRVEPDDQPTLQPFRHEATAKAVSRDRRQDAKAEKSGKLALPENEG